MTRWPALALHASLGLPGEPPLSTLPLPWHWLYFLEAPEREQQGRDGHPQPGGFFPPVQQPRRMFVGGRSQLQRPLRFDQPAQLTESIRRCEPRQGRSGSMTLLTVAYDYVQSGRSCLVEERDFMYLPDRSGAAVTQRPLDRVAVPAAELSLDLATDPVLLFKFSALTFNGHRIHYDRDYARDVEGYPATVVHGPLTALALAWLAAGSTPLKEFIFRAQAPLFCGDLLRLRGHPEGDKLCLTAYRPDGKVAMTAEAKR